MQTARSSIGETTEVEKQKFISSSEFTDREMSFCNGHGERQDGNETYLNGYLDESERDGDRYMIDFIKGVMAQERAVKTDMIEVLKEQILVLRQELFHKQSIIDTLLRNYDPPCVHGNMKNNHHGNTAITPFNNPINVKNPISYDSMAGNTPHKPVITLYNTNNPITSPFSSNMVNNRNNCPLLNPYISDNPISSLVSKTVDKYEDSLQSCQDSPVITPPSIIEKGSNTRATDLTNWKYTNTPSILPTSKPTADNDAHVPKNDESKPLSETLLNVRNIIKSNIPRPQKENTSPRRESLLKRDNMMQNKMANASSSKDVIATHKTFRVKFNKNGWQEKWLQRK